MISQLFKLLLRSLKTQQSVLWHEQTLEISKRLAWLFKPLPEREFIPLLLLLPAYGEKLNLQPGQVIEAAVSAIREAKKYTDDIEFSCEDASRSEPEFLYRIIEAAIREEQTRLTFRIPSDMPFHLFSENLSRI